MQTIRIDTSIKGITHILLNRPEKRNALSFKMLEELTFAVESANHDPKQRVILFSPEGSFFSSGLDLQEALEQNPEVDLGEGLKKLLNAIFCSHCVTISAVFGGAIAGGAGIMAATDYVIADKDSIFSCPEVKIGMIAALIMPFLFARVPFGHLRSMLLFGEKISASKALSIHLVDQITSSKDLLPAAMDLAKKALKAAPEAIKMTKYLLNELLPFSLEETLNSAGKVHRLGRFSNEAKEGISAFLEKREPNWSIL